MIIKKIKGTRDYFDIDQNNFDEILKILESFAYRYGFSKIQLPNMEFSELFNLGIGETTDVVSKEMFSFKDKKNRSISLKPEGTASTVRMILENKLVEQNQERKYFYFERMYRYERPQKGRQREFFQFGAEWFNSRKISSEIQLIQLINDILKRLKICKYELHINTIGNVKERNIFSEKLKEYFNSRKEELSIDSQDKINKNVLRILDSKDEKDIEISNNAPSLMEYISNEEKNEFHKITTILDKLGIKYIKNDKLVRGLDYYNGFVFEFISTDIENLGAKATIAGGGRYDKLITIFDEKKENTPSIGFAIGMERLILASRKYLEEIERRTIDYDILLENDDQLENALIISNKLRNYGYIVNLDDSNRSITKKKKKAEKNNVKNLILFKDEKENNIIYILNLKNKEKKELNIEEI